MYNKIPDSDYSLIIWWRPLLCLMINCSVLSKGNVMFQSSPVVVCVVVYLNILHSCRGADGECCLSQVLGAKQQMVVSVPWD